MKIRYFLRSILPMLGLVMTSCETSGQLLAGGVCTNVAIGAVAVGVAAAIADKFQNRKVMA